VKESFQNGWILAGGNVQTALITPIPSRYLMSIETMLLSPRHKVADPHPKLLTLDFNVMAPDIKDLPNQKWLT